MKPCVFFDRDGIVNRSPGPGYVESWEAFHLQPEFVQALRVVRAAGIDAAIITNQRGVALGCMSRATVEFLHQRLRDLLLSEHGLELLDIRYCPHDNGQCTCRKPQPGMLLAMAADYHLDLARSWMIGDQETDILAGRAAGCRTILVSGSRNPSVADRVIPAMSALAAVLREELRDGLKPEA